MLDSAQFLPCSAWRWKANATRWAKVFFLHFFKRCIQCANLIVEAEVTIHTKAVVVLGVQRLHTFKGTVYN